MEWRIAQSGAIDYNVSLYLIFYYHRLPEIIFNIPFICRVTCLLHRNKRARRRICSGNKRRKSAAETNPMTLTLNSVINDQNMHFFTYLKPIPIATILYRFNHYKLGLKTCDVFDFVMCLSLFFAFNSTIALFLQWTPSKSSLLFTASLYNWARDVFTSSSAIQMFLRQLFYFIRNPNIHFEQQNLT